MELGPTLRYLFPNADFRQDVVIKDDGDGQPYIAEWNLIAPRPTQEQLDQAWIDVQMERTNQEIEREQIRTNAKTARQQLEILLDTPAGEWRQADIVIAIKMVIHWLMEHDQ